jgi:hypothetical protein
MSEPKKVSYEFVDGKLVVKVDLNGDGEPVIELKLDVKELPEEAISAWKAARA